MPIDGVHVDEISVGECEVFEDVVPDFDKEHLAGAAFDDEIPAVLGEASLIGEVREVAIVVEVLPADNWNEKDIVG